MMINTETRRRGVTEKPLCLCVSASKRFIPPRSKTRIKRAAIILMLGLLAGLLLACKKHHDNSPVIASVNGDEVTRAQFERFVATKLGEVSGNDTADALRSQMLDEYLRRRLGVPHT